VQNQINKANWNPTHHSPSAHVPASCQGNCHFPHRPVTSVIFIIVILLAHMFERRVNLEILALAAKL
jgi:hypothetical protein